MFLAEVFDFLRKIGQKITNSGSFYAGGKVAIAVVEGCHNREDDMVEIRKSKWAECLQKKRREGFPSVPSSQPSISDDTIISLDETLLNFPVVEMLGSDSTSS